MVDPNPTTLITTLNFNSKLSNKKQKLTEWIKNMMQLYFFYERQTLNIKIQIEKWIEKICHANSKHKESGVNKLLTNK